MHAPAGLLLPLQAQDLLASLVGRRLTSVHHLGMTPEDGGSAQREVYEGELGLTLDDGRTLRLGLDEARRSVVVGLGEGPGVGHDVSQSAFWRWRLRRELAGVAVWKSHDVHADAQELEFGLELRLRVGPPAVLELVERDGVAVLVATDGEGAEPHRWIAVAGDFPPPPELRRRLGRVAPSARAERPGSRRRR